MLVVIVMILVLMVIFITYKIGFVRVWVSPLSSLHKYLCFPDNIFHVEIQIIYIRFKFQRKFTRLFPSSQYLTLIPIVGLGMLQIFYHIKALSSVSLHLNKKCKSKQKHFKDLFISISLNLIALIKSKPQINLGLDFINIILFISCMNQFNMKVLGIDIQLCFTTSNTPHEYLFPY